jgi:alpha-L-rhamnosidase
MTILSSTNLRCEYLIEPLGVDAMAPRFSWNLDHPGRGQLQRAYQVIISSNYEKIQSEIGLEWDSGRVESDETVSVVYAGEELKSTSLYYWRVRWWDVDGNESPYSDISYFGTGFVRPEDWRAKWMSMKNPVTFTSTINTLVRGIDRESPQYHAIYMKKTFGITKAVKRARVFVSGLGYYEFRMNGQKVGDHLLDPGQTDYHHISLYASYDVTHLVGVGENTLGVILGNGRHIKAYGYDKPRCILQLVVEYEDGQKDVVVSDSDWKVSHGPLMENGMYYGERYDARKEMPGWKKVRIKPHILGDLTDATATVQTVRGEIYVSWEKKPDLLRLLLSIPTNVMADLFIPASGETTTIEEGGAIVWAEGKGAGQVNGITPIEAVEDYVHMRAGSGYYEFEVYG